MDMLLKKLSQTDSMWFYILLSGLFYWLAHSLTRPIIALYAQSLGISEMKIGFVIGIYAVLPFLLAIPSGGIADSIGRVKVLRIGALLMFISGLLYMFAFNIYLLVIAQIVAGIGQMTVWLVIQVLVTTDKQNQPQRIASFTVYNAIGQMMGPLIGGFLSEKYNMTLSFGVYTLISFLLILLVYQLKETDTYDIPDSKINIKKMYANGGRLLKNKGFIATLLCTFIVLFIIDVRMTFLPIYLQEINISPFKIGILISIGAFSALLVKPIYPTLIEKLGYKVLLAVTFISSLSLLFLTPFLTHFFGFIILILFSGVALGINQPLSLSLISESTNENERGIAVGLRLMSNRLAQLIDPLLFGIVTLYISIKAAFLLTGLLLFVLSIVTVLLLQTEKRKEKKANFHETAL
jgi:MFS family permease